MIIKGYNITLKRLVHEDIEMVRQWRNSQAVSRFMEIREEITPLQQEEWFKKIDTIHNNYFLIIENHTPVGLIYGAEIDWEKGITGNGGIFLAQEQYFNSDIPIRATFLIIDTGVLLGLKTQYVKVLNDNYRAKFFNKKLGYKLLQGEEKNYNQKYYLEANHYLASAKALKKAMNFSESELIEIVIDNPDHPVSKNIISTCQKKVNQEVNRLKLIFI
ncbi:MAG TPA: GNAT family N-acetyltransferase [Flavobacteriales bacterium]|nr:GNAT family N-acetyltransferase [Flavobacteriales bacterium]